MSSSTQKLYAVMLGGRAPKCNTELHDIVFVIGEAIEATYEQLMDLWFGEIEDLHIDAWVELNIVDGYKIALSKQPMKSDTKLYFVNLGAYAEDVFGELHGNVFVVAGSKKEAKAQAKARSAKSLSGHLHTDYLHKVDDCIAMESVGGYSVRLTASDEQTVLQPVNGYHIIPDAVIQNYIERRART